MKKISPLALLAAALTLAACGPTLKVHTDYDKSVDFTRYKTFSIYQNDSSSSAISPLNQQRITTAVVAAMQRKGYQQASSDPDLLINPVTIVKNKIALSSNTDYYGYGGVYRPYYWGTGLGVSSTTNYNIQNYKDGSLIIDVVDANTKKLLWQGTGNSEIDKPLKDPDTEVPAAVNKILAGFPPGATK